MVIPPEIPLQSAQFHWFVAGGWALDLFLNRHTRPHTDVDLGIFRRDQFILQGFFSEWNLQKVVDGVFSSWKLGEELTLPVHEVHARHPRLGEIEILIAEASETEWLYRRNSGVRRSISKAILSTFSGIRVLAPEIVLLFKSKSPKPKDEADFQTVLTALSNEQRNWLHDALEFTEPGHHWRTVIAEFQAANE